MTKKRFLILYICVVILAAILIFAFWPMQWTVVEATDSAGWKLSVHKTPFHRLDYLISCIVDFTTSPNLQDYYYRCVLSRRGRTVSSRTFAWPSYYPKDFQIEFLDVLQNSNRTADIQFDEFIKVRCSWSHDQTIWKEIETN